MLLQYDAEVALVAGCPLSNGPTLLQQATIIFVLVNRPCAISTFRHFPTFTLPRFFPRFDVLKSSSVGYEAELAGSKAVAPPALRRWGKNRPYHGAVVAIEGLCNISSADDKNTYRVEIDLGDSSMEYLPGDALGIYPQNAPEVGMLA